MLNQKLKVIDIFAGIGGFRKGIENATDKCEFVWASEWDKYANSVYRKHYGECDNRDIRDVKGTEIPDCDLIVGGVPCQSWSIAGKRGGFEDERGNMWFECFRLLREKRPKYFLFENVKGLLSHNGGKSMERICEELCECGFAIDFEVLNSKNFGVAQNRERVFIVGMRLDLLDDCQLFKGKNENNRQTKKEITRESKNKDDGIQLSSRFQQHAFAKRHLRGTSRSEVFPLTESNPKALKQIISGGQGNRVYDSSGTSCTIASQAGGQGAKTGLYAVPVLTPDRANKRQNGRRMKTDGEPSFTLTAQDKHGIYDGTKIRRLTPTECMRLQGFPDSWCDYGADGEVISNSQKYKMMGNAVTTNVVSEIIKRMFDL